MSGPPPLPAETRHTRSPRDRRDPGSPPIGRGLDDALASYPSAALGATRAHIRRQFLGESVLLAGLGGVGGSVLGGVVTAGFAASRVWPFALPLWVLGGAAAATIRVGTLACVYPAARMSPISALATA